MAKHSARRIWIIFAAWRFHSGLGNGMEQNLFEVLLPPGPGMIWTRIGFAKDYCYDFHLLGFCLRTPTGKYFGLMKLQNFCVLFGSQTGFVKL